jgi:hypothetical protein
MVVRGVHHPVTLKQGDVPLFHPNQEGHGLTLLRAVVRPSRAPSAFHRQGFLPPER